MEVFSQLIRTVSEAPDWVPLLMFPLLCLFAAAGLALFGARRFYPPVAGGLNALGFVLVAAKGDTSAALVYFGLFFCLSALFSLLLRLPRIKRKKKESREERIYRKFHVESETPPQDAMPPKVRCFAAPPATAEESGMRLDHVASLMTKLKSCKLTPADRLELDVLERSVNAYRGRALGEEELASLNDCLACVLKLTAKYKL